VLQRDPNWVSPWWQVAALPDSWRVCGVKVPALSVWHVYALENIGNRYIVGKGEPDLDDVTSLLLVASRDMEHGKWLLYRDGYSFRRRFLMTVRMWLYLRRHGIEGMLEDCREYVDGCMRHGTRMSKGGEGGGTPAGTPEPWAIVSMLIRAGVDYHTAWNHPYSSGRAVMDAEDEHSGNTIMTPADYGEYMVEHWEEVKDIEGVQKVRLN
jgi:hypothetical protein